MTWQKASAVKDLLIRKEKEVAHYAGFEVRCHDCGYVPEYYVSNSVGFGVVFWCVPCKKSVEFPKRKIS